MQLKIVVDNQRLMDNLAHSKPVIKTARQMEKEFRHSSETARRQRDSVKNFSSAISTVIKRNESMRTTVFSQ